MFSYNGVLRTVMQLYLAAPEHVFLLRGNHEYYIEYRGRIYGGVKPAEAINTLIGHIPGEVFQEYMKMFEELPNMLFFDDLMFVHAGIPRDTDIKAQVHRPGVAQRSRHALPDAVERSVDGRPHPRRSAGAERAVPVRQAAVRGVHGAARLLDDGARPREGRRRASRRCTATSRRCSRCSPPAAPTTTTCRPTRATASVTPMAATIRLEGGTAQVTPWLIDYKRFNDPKRNRFFASPPEIEHKVG